MPPSKPAARRPRASHAIQAEPRTPFELVVKTRLDALAEQITRVEVWVRTIAGAMLVGLALEVIRSIAR